MIYQKVVERDTEIVYRIFVKNVHDFETYIFDTDSVENSLKLTGARRFFFTS